MYQPSLRRLCRRIFLPSRPPPPMPLRPLRRRLRISHSKGSTMKKISLRVTLLSAPIVAAVFLWAVSLKEIDPRLMNDLGLVSILPAAMIVSLVILLIGFALALNQPQTRTPILLLYVLTLI